MMHVDQYTADGRYQLAMFLEGSESYAHFATKHPEGHDNGYVVTTPPHESEECRRYVPRFEPITHLPR